MNVEPKVAWTGTREEPAFKPNRAGTKAEALNDRSGLAFTGLGSMTTADWDVLKLEFHQKLQELKKSGDGCWQRIKSDLETKIAALEDSIKLSDSGSENMRHALGFRQRSITDRSAEQTQPSREHSELKEARTNRLPNLAA